MTSRPSPPPGSPAERPRCRRQGVAPGWLVALLAVSLGSVQATAQDRDRVVVRQRDGRGRLTHVGVITEYNAVELVIRARGRAAPWRVPVDRIVSVTPSRSTHHLAARRHLNRGEIAVAERSFQQALEQSSRKWVRRELLAGLVRCALFSGDYRRAGSHFLSLSDGPTRPRHFELVPLDWRITGSVDAAVASEARAWRGRGGDVAKLLAASHLLRDSAYSSEAETELRRLRISADSRVRGLALAQCWRADSWNKKSTPEQLAAWTRHVRSLPLNLRGGPWYVVGLARFQSQQFQPAASALMWTSLVFDDDRFLAAHATQRAADALLNDNQPAAAGTLYRDLRQRFAGTPAALESATSRQNPPRPRRNSK